MSSPSLSQALHETASGSQRPTRSCTAGKRPIVDSDSESELEEPEEAEGGREEWLPSAGSSQHSDADEAVVGNKSGKMKKVAKPKVSSSRALPSRFRLTKDLFLQAKKQKFTPDQAVPLPAGELILNLEERQHDGYKLGRGVAKHWAKRTPIFKADFTLESLAARPINTAAEKKKMEQPLKDLETQPAQVQSGRWCDANGKPLAAYFSWRLSEDGPVKKSLVRIVRTFNLLALTILQSQVKPLSEQYEGRTLADMERMKAKGHRFQYDGIKVSLFDHLALLGGR